MSKDFTARYWHIKPSRTLDKRGNYEFEPVDEADVPDNVPIYVMGMHEDAKGLPNYNAHWSLFHQLIAKDAYIRLSHKADPVKAERFNNKAEAEAKYGPVEKEEKNKKTRRLSILNCVNQLDDEYWLGWTDDERKALKFTREHAGKIPNADAVKPVMDIICNRLEDAGHVITEAHAIIHDEDNRVITDHLTDEETKELKALHIHWLIRIADEIRGKDAFEQVGKIFGIAPENIVAPGRGRYAWMNPLAYLIHAKDEDKHQYRPTDVYTFTGKPYIEYYREFHREWEMGRGKKAKKDTTEHLDWVLDRVRRELLGEDDLRDKDGDYFYYYSRHQRAFDDALNFAADQRRWEELQRFLDGEFSLTTLFIQGASGTGKTTAANAIIKFFETVYGWKVARCASRNAVEDWKGEQIMLLDDVSHNAFNADEWKRLLDENNASAMSARYRNAAPGKPRLIIITSTTDPSIYFSRISALSGENLSQYYRRLSVILQVEDSKQWGTYNYSLKTAQKADSYTFSTVLRQSGHVGDDANVKQTFNDLTYAFKTPEHLLVDGEEPMLNAVSAVAEVVRIIDEHNDNRVAAHCEHRWSKFSEAVAPYVLNEYAPTPIDIPDDILTMPLAVAKEDALPVVKARIKAEYEEKIKGHVKHDESTVDETELEFYERSEEHDEFIGAKLIGVWFPSHDDPERAVQQLKEDPEFGCAKSLNYILNTDAVPEALASDDEFMSEYGNVRCGVIACPNAYKGCENTCTEKARAQLESSKSLIFLSNVNHYASDNSNENESDNSNDNKSGGETNDEV